jgi:hypothetical protein
LPLKLEEYVRIVCCHRGSEPTLPWSLLPSLASTLQAGKLEVIGSTRPGESVAAYGAAFWAGRLALTLPPGTEIDLFSDDPEMEIVVDLLGSAGRRARRIGAPHLRVAGSTPEMPTGVRNEERSALTDLAEDFVAHGLPRTARPTKRTALLNTLRAYFREVENDVDPEEILRHLFALGIVEMGKKGKLAYPPERHPPTPTWSADDIPF